MNPINVIKLRDTVVTYKILSFVALSLSNCPMIKLVKITKTIILKTNVLPNNVVIITVTKALIPND